MCNYGLNMEGKRFGDFKACCCKIFFSFTFTPEDWKTVFSDCMNCLYMNPLFLLHPSPGSSVSLRQRLMKGNNSALIALRVRLYCWKTWLPVNSGCYRTVGLTPVEPQNASDLPPPAVTQCVSVEYTYCSDRVCVDVCAFFNRTELVCFYQWPDWSALWPQPSCSAPLHRHEKRTCMTSDPLCAC